MLANQSSTPVIKIFLVDDLRVAREKVKEILQPHRDLQIVGIATDGDSAIEQLEYLQPDTILLDLDMPHLDGWATARIISHEYPHIDIIILSSSIESLDNKNAMTAEQWRQVVKEQKGKYYRKKPIDDILQEMMRKERNKHENLINTPPTDTSVKQTPKRENPQDKSDFGAKFSEKPTTNNNYNKNRNTDNTKNKK